MCICLMSLRPLLVLTPKKAFRGGAARFLFSMLERNGKELISAIPHLVWLSYKQHLMKRCFCSFSQENPALPTTASCTTPRLSSWQPLVPGCWEFSHWPPAQVLGSLFTGFFPRSISLSHMHPHTVLPKVCKISQHLWKGVRGPGKVFPRRD